MRFSTVLAILAPASAAFAVQWNVTVGNFGALAYSPTSLTGVITGDTVVFFFASKNHTVTQSSFTAPCTKLNDTDVDSGFSPVDSTTEMIDVFSGNNSAIPTFTYDVTDTSAPLWFYCKQTNPISHCESGMVFAINPTADKTFAAFKLNAENSFLTSASTVTSGSSSVLQSITLSLSTLASSTLEPSSAPPSSSSETSPSSSDVLPLSSSASSLSSAGASSPSSGASAPSSDAATSAPPTSLFSSSDSIPPSSSSASACPTNSSPAGTLRVGKPGALLGSVGLLAFVL